MKLTHAEIDRLYSEPSFAANRPEPVLARLIDGSELALCFNLPTAPQAADSNPDYARCPAGGCSEDGLARDLRGGSRWAVVPASVF
jgi:hypothetical protein